MNSRTKSHLSGHFAAYTLHQVSGGGGEFSDKTKFHLTFIVVFIYYLKFTLFQDGLGDTKRSIHGS